MSQKLLSSLKSLPVTKARSDIVNPKLCDNIIQRLKPSLAQYVGCTIIDINPGASLFSQKLHDLLKPRSHVLLEPNPERYAQFLKTLLEAPASRYHLRDWPDERCWDTEYFIREGLMPSAEGVGGPAPTTDVPNNRALILGNVTNWAQIAHGRARNLNYASLKALDFARRARHHTRSIGDNATRLLLWTADSEKYPLVPRTVDSRGRTSAFLEPYCHVEEIVGSNKPRKQRREHALDTRSEQRVAERIRKGSALKPPREGDVGSENAGLSGTYRDWHQELQELEEGFKAMTIPQFVGHSPGPLKKITRGSNKALPERSPEFTRMMQLQRILKGQNAEIEKVGNLLQMQTEIDHLDYEAAQSESIDEDKQLSKYQDIDNRIAELKEAQGKLTKKELYRFMFLDDDRRAFEMQPPSLCGIAGLNEPLIAHEDDFFNPKELALLDFQAKPVSDLRTTTANQDMYYDMLVSAAMSHKTPINAKFLNTVGPGAYQALLKHAPSLQNPLKGGRRDVESVRARAMTPEMFYELAVAWDAWPFKPAMSDAVVRESTAMANLQREGGPAARI